MAPGQHVFKLVQVDRDGDEHFGAETTVEVGVAGGYHLSSVYPNPVRKRATLDLAVAHPQSVTAALYDTRGRKVRTLFEGRLSADAPEQVRVATGALASGVYMVRVQGERFEATRTLTLVR